MSITRAIFVGCVALAMAPLAILILPLALAEVSLYQEFERIRREEEGDDFGEAWRRTTC